VNCCDPRDATLAVPLAAAASGKPVVVYPNSGESWDASARAWTGQSTMDGFSPGSWLTDGARLIGGCCRVTPADITLITTTLAQLH
jgi:homocysteine S-methyltransferase